MRQFVFAAALVLTIVVIGFAPNVALAGEGEGDVRTRDPRDLSGPSEQVRRMLSGRAWLVTSGLDPTLGLGLGEVKDAPAASGSGSPASQAGGAALVPYRDPSAKFSRNILIPSDFSEAPFQTEPSIAVDPSDPNHLLVGMIDYNFNSMVSYSSIDGGATWEGPRTAKYPRDDLASAGDPIVAFDRQGNAHYASISLDVEEFIVGPLLGSAVVSAISVSHSTDGGATWTDPVRANKSDVKTTDLPTTTDGRPRGEITMGFLDKPWMTIGPDPNDPTKDIVYVVYTRFDETSQVLWLDELPVLSPTTLETVIEVVKSEDRGVTWSAPLAVSPRAQYRILFNEAGLKGESEGERGGLQQEGDGRQSPPQQEGPLAGTRRIVQGPDVAIAPDGTVYVAWLDTTPDDSFEGSAEIYVSASRNGGRTFQTPQLAASFLEPPFQARDVPFRSWASAFPKLAVGPDNSVYLAWMALPTDDPDDDGDIFSIASRDGGRTWSRRVKINDDQTSAFQFFPEIVVDPKGTIHAMWGDYRDDPKHVSFHVYYASSEDGGKTWGINSRVTDFASNPNHGFPRGRFIGDYFGITATDQDVYMVWADSRLGEFGPTNQKIGFARKRLMPEPSVFISPPSGPAGKDIVVQGFNFQPDRDIFVEVAGVVVSTARTQKDGRFSTQIFVPISGEGAHNLRVIEESGNTATTSYFMDFGFDTVRKSLDTVQTQVQRTDAAVSGNDGVQAKVGQLQTDVDALKASKGGAPWWTLAVMAVLGAAIGAGAVALAVGLRRPKRGGL